MGEKIVEEIEGLREDFDMADIREVIKDIDFFNNNESDECVEKYCENLQTTQGFCRFHYIKNWKTIKKKALILKEGKLQLFIEELINKFPAKYIEAIMQDLSGDKEFYLVLKDLNIDTNYQYDDNVTELEGEEDITVETRGFSSTRGNYDEDDMI